MAHVALITGITGQDGSYLAELLLGKGYIVHGLIRRASTFNTERLDHLYRDPHDPEARLLLHYGDLSDSSQLTNLFYDVKPDEVYHLGAQSHVRVSFDMPDYTGDIEKAESNVASIKLQAARCSETHPHRRASKHPFAHEVPMLQRRPMPTGWCRPTVRDMASLPVTASCSTTSPQGGERPLFREKLPVPLLPSSQGDNKNSSSVILKPAATGGTRQNTWWECG